MLRVQRRPFLIRQLRKLFYTCVPPLQLIFWYVFRPSRPGVKTFVFYKNKLLLVRMGYSHKCWVLPGGGIERGETPPQAAIREVKEESGLDVVGPEYIGQHRFVNEYKRVTVHYFTIETSNSDLTIDGQEIIDAGWFSLDALPAECAPRLANQINLYNEWKLHHSV